MKRRLVLAGLMVPTLVGRASLAAANEPVPVPDGFVFVPGPLDAVRTAVRKKSLVLMAIVGPHLSVEAARDPTMTYPTQLLARLRIAWPGVNIRLALLPIARTDAVSFQRDLVNGLSQHVPNLVLWGPGGSASARGDDISSFHAQVSSGIKAVQSAGADLILMTPQFAPILARLMDLPPYRDTVLHEAQDAGVPVLDRYELMRYWSDNAFLDLDASTQSSQTSVARQANGWIAELLTGGITRAIS
jgi:hypothetical protein